MNVDQTHARLANIEGNVTGVEAQWKVDQGWWYQNGGRGRGAEEQEGYDKEELLHMHVMSDEEEQESYEPEPEQDSWRISRLVSADAFGAGHDTGDIQTGRMKNM